MTARLMFTVFAFVAGFLLLPHHAEAQDAHYWTVQYGNRSRLLGGTVIGSSTDLSSVYYNPGLLGLIENKELILSGTVYQVTGITVRNALGEEQDLTWNKTGGAPSLFAGELRFGFLGKHRLAYSFLTRNEFDLRFEARNQFRPEDLGLTSNIDFLSLKVGFESKMSDYWAGLTWSYPVHPNVGIGASQFVSVRSQRNRNASTLQAQADTSGGISYLADEFDYNHTSLIWKFGAGAQWDPWRLGVTITTPNLKVMGTGSVGYDETVIAQDLNNDGVSTTRVISDFQQDIPANWKTPLSIGFGAGFSRKDITRLHFSLEWFDGLGEFVVLDAEPFTSADSTIVRESDVLAVLNSVTNYGIGIEHKFSPRLEGYVSFRTDKSATEVVADASATIAIWDIYHLAGGATFEVSESEFTLGAVYAFGGEPTQFGLNVIPDDLDDGDATGLLPDKLDTEFRRLTFLLGFSLSF